MLRAFARSRENVASFSCCILPTDQSKTSGLVLEMWAILFVVLGWAQRVEDQESAAQYVRDMHWHAFSAYPDQEFDR